MFADCDSLTDVWITNDRNYTENDYKRSGAFENCHNLNNIWVMRNDGEKTISHVVKYYNVRDY